MISVLPTIVNLLLLGIACAEGSTSEVVGFIKISGLCSSKLDRVDRQEFNRALESDVQSLLWNASINASIASPSDITVVVTGVLVEALNGNQRFSFDVQSTFVSPVIVLQWNSFLADLSQRQNGHALQLVSELYRAVTIPLNETTGFYCNETSGSTLKILSGACTLEASATSPQDDQCGPFSCYGFAMVALLCSLALSVGVTFYCCTRWRSKDTAQKQGESTMPEKDRQAPVNPADSDDEDPFSDQSKPVTKVPHATPAVAVPAPTSPARGPMAENARDDAAGELSSSPRSRMVSPRRQSVVKIREPHEEASTTPTLTLPRAWKGPSSGVSNRPPPSAPAQKPQQPTLDEEKRRLESQPWIWKHVEHL